MVGTCIGLAGNLPELQRALDAVEGLVSRTVARRGWRHRVAPDGGD